MKKFADQKIINFFFPKFSEIDTAVLLSAILMPLVENLPSLSKVLIFYQREVFGYRSDFIILILFIIWVGLVLKNIFSSKQLDKNSSGYIATIYYMLIAIISITLIDKQISGTILTSPTENILGKIYFLFNKIMLFYLFVKNFITIMLLRFMEEKSIVLLNDRCSNKQTNLVEFFVVFILCMLIYPVHRLWYDGLQSVYFTYFYTLTLVNFYTSIKVKNNI